MANKIKEFYDNEYHFDEDFEKGMPKKRFYRMLDPLGLDGSGAYLDIGCGVGHSLKYSLNRNTKTVGLDLSEKALKLADQETKGNAIIVCGDGENLPFETGTFKFVSALGVIEHFPSPNRGASEIARILSSDGKAVIVVPSSFGFLSKIGLWKGTEQEQELMLTMKEWIALLDKEGLKVEKTIAEVGPPIFKNYKPIKVIQRIMLKSVRLLPTSCAYGFIFLCSKK